MPQHDDQPPAQLAPDDPIQVVAAIREAVEGGRRPRANRPLRLAARSLRAAGRLAEAGAALRLAAEIELRRDRPAQALSPARLALRLARADSRAADLDDSLKLLVEAYGRAGEHVRAHACAVQRLDAAAARGDRPPLVRARASLALAAWRAGRGVEALSHAIAAERDAGIGAVDVPELISVEVALVRMIGAITLTEGCPAWVNDDLTRSIRRWPDEAAAADYLLRGWARLCIGAPGTAARDFRRARRQSRAGDHTLGTLEADVSLAIADLVRPASPAGAAARAVRLVNRGRRLRDPQLTQSLNLLDRVLAGERCVPGANRRDAAQALVRTAYATDNQELVDACLREVRRFARLREGDPPYAFDPHLAPVMGMFAGL